jgi:hypothetical protein
MPIPTIQPLKRRVLRKRKAVVEVTNPPSPVPVLVQVMYEEGSRVTLVFDRAMDFSAFNTELLFVNDSPTELMYYGQGESIPISATACEVVLAVYGNGSAGLTWMTVEPGNGITAANGGPAWAGVSALAVPFP